MGDSNCLRHISKSKTVQRLADVCLWVPSVCVLCGNVQIYVPVYNEIYINHLEYVWKYESLTC